jgi:hypothetical protein
MPNFLKQTIAIINIYLLFNVLGGVQLFGQAQPLSGTQKTAQLPKAITATTASQGLTNTVVINADTIKKDPIFIRDTSHPFNKFIYPISKNQAELIPIKSLPKQQKKNSDWLFYLSAGLVIVLGLLKNFTGSHAANVFKVLFKAGLKNTDANKQLTQALIPTLLLNTLFVFAFGGFLYLYAIKVNYKINFFVIIGLTVIYIGKYFIVKFLSWVLNHDEAGRIYLLRFFIVNQVAAVFFTPIIIILMLANQVNFLTQVFNVGLIAAVVFYVFRLFYSTLPYRKLINLNWLHYLFFIVCLELLPFLLLQKSINLYFLK